MRKIIDLKIVQPHFDAVGDMLILREWTGTEYTGRKISATITHILKDCGFGLAEGYVILSIKLRGGEKCQK